MAKKKFGIIGEGVTDQIIIEYILHAIVGSDNIEVAYLQPREGESGNWDKVFKYCASSDFKDSIPFRDYIVIQIDTDFMTRDGVPEHYKINLDGLDVEGIVNCFRNKFEELIGPKFFSIVAGSIIFAIAVSQTECWFLPAYFPSQPAKAQKNQNCIDTLNPALNEQEGFFIKSKDPEYYHQIGKNKFRKAKDIKSYAPSNLSLSLFLNELNTKISTGS